MPGDFGALFIVVGFIAISAGVIALPLYLVPEVRKRQPRLPLPAAGLIALGSALVIAVLTSD